MTVKQVETNTAHGDIMKEVAEHLLPELKEGESERIRKELRQYLEECSNLLNGHYCKADFFAWIERQGEQKSAWKPSEEQIKVLKEICVLKKSTATGAVLCELYHDLKKLREE